MTENTTDKGDDLISEEYRIILSVIGGILSNESVSLPTKGNELCLYLTETVAKCFSVGLSKQAVEFASWLVEGLKGVIIKEQKRGKPNELSKERLWRNFQKLTSFNDFTLK